MPTRRDLLAASGGLLAGAVGTYAGLSLAATGHGTIQWANERDEEVRVVKHRLESALVAF